MKTVTLDAKQRQEILGRRRQTGERRLFQRLSAPLWIDEGRSREEVAELLGVTSHQVGDWLRIFRNKGLDQGHRIKMGVFHKIGKSRHSD